MKSFKEYIIEGKVRKQQGDPSEARSLFRQAEERFLDLKQLPLHENNAPFRFEDAYEVLREALQAFLAEKGYKSYSHEAIFSFAGEERILNEADARRADRYREIRNDINYRGQKVLIEEAREILSFVKRVLPELKRKFEEKMKK